MSSDAQRAAAKRFRERHPEKMREASAKYRERHPNRIKEISKKYYDKNKELVKKSQAIYRATPEYKLKNNIRQKEYQKKKKEDPIAAENMKKYKKSWQQDNSDKTSEYQKKWREKNPNYYKDYQARKKLEKQQAQASNPHEAMA